MPCPSQTKSQAKPSTRSSYLLAWSPYSPDLTPPDFFVWGFVKDIVYSQKPRNIDDLRVKITQAFQQITPLMLQRTWAELHHRYELCRVQVSTHPKRRADIIAINGRLKRALVLDPTIRFERNLNQATEVDIEKKSIYEPCLPYLSQKYNVPLKQWSVIGLLFGSRGSITKFTWNYLKELHIPFDSVIAEISAAIMVLTTEKKLFIVQRYFWSYGVRRQNGPACVTLKSNTRSDLTNNTTMFAVVEKFRRTGSFLCLLPCYGILIFKIESSYDGTEKNSPAQGFEPGFSALRADALSTPDTHPSVGQNRLSLSSNSWVPSSGRPLHYVKDVYERRTEVVI
ncbi:hypothetical protein ANN_12112 [Periplaneta americana]|uniref:Uncharacterized protein n=1 Tax=Periplaneta americana TaxID=6978 RepID=A0ABQ8T8F9_PERAM|nr:hypothetical protein ANN_12112 [Periplaneta americana]